ncbi:hypothetical protein BM1_02274 [Bipolaris maydis]|nr:hypothetical protein BM1_02274 [Bipolaris maydis]
MYVVNSIMRIPAQLTERIYQSYITSLEKKPSNAAARSSKDLQEQQTQNDWTEIDKTTPLASQCIGMTRIGERCQRWKNMPPGSPYNCGKHKK